jgi:hypothetical protein
MSLPADTRRVKAGILGAVVLDQQLYWQLQEADFFFP